MESYGRGEDKVCLSLTIIYKRSFLFIGVSLDVKKKKRDEAG